VSSLNILVVDDASFIRDMIKKAVRNAFPSSTLHDAANGRKAQLILNKMPFDLVLCDWEMPEMSGHELLQWMRSNEGTQKTPFVMISSRSDKEYVIQAVQAGVSDYLGKPFSNEQLIAKVKKVLAKSGKLKQAVSAPKSQGSAFGSIDVLTKGSASSKATTPKNQNSAFGSVDVLTKGNTSTPQKIAKPAPSKRASFKGKANLRFSDFSTSGLIKELTLKKLVAIIPCKAGTPKILDQAVIDIEHEAKEDVARINGFVHTLQSADNTMTSEYLTLVINFVDKDPQKLEQLSKFISSI